MPQRKERAMRFSTVISLGILLLMFASTVYGSWEADLARVLEMEPGKEQDKLITTIVRAEPGIEEVTEYIATMHFPAVETGRLLLDSTVCLDDIERPWVLYVPPTYEPGEPSPLLLRLHGGVSRAEIFEDPVGYAEEDGWLPVAERLGWFVLYPLGQDGATWWDRIGMANIRNLIRTVKRGYNIDDDRVWMAGFSDGASAGFTWAMVEPDCFAAVVALNGHIGVGSLDGDLPLYAANLANTPVYAVTTEEDELYPTRVMGSTIEMAVRAGADILYRSLEGRHEFSYAEEELPRVAAFLRRHPRDPFPGEVIWEAGVPEFGACRWLKIDRITNEEPEAWHTDFNCALVNERITIGFMADDAFEGEGVRVGRVVEETPAEDMGLAEGDVIVKGGSMPIAGMDDLVRFKAGLGRGDAFELTVRRGEGITVLGGAMPEPANYLVFKRELPSGLVKARYLANRIEIESSRVGALSILLHPDMVNPDSNLSVIWNGRLVYDDRVTPDLEYMIRNFAENRDRRLIYAARLSLEAPED